MSMGKFIIRKDGYMGNLQVIDYKDIRVLTTQQVAMSYESNTDTITKNFNRNKERYFEGKHFICLEGAELKKFKTTGQNDLSLRTNKLYLWTEKGCLLHAKSLNTDKAWEAYDILVETYFNIKKPLTAIEQLQLTQQAILEVNTKIESVNEDLQNFKMDMPILGIEESQITNAVKRKGVECLGGKDLPAYHNKSLRAKVYSDIYGQLKREFEVSSYKAIKRSQADIAVGVINNYKLPYNLQQQIYDENSQISFREEIA